LQQVGGFPPPLKLTAMI